MPRRNNKLIIRQLDIKIGKLQPLKTFNFPSEGWINLLRQTLNMSLRQLGNRLSMTPQGIRSIEKREKEGSVTINTLREAANALDMKFVYAFVPKDDSLEKIIERKAREIAVGIVNRTALTMKLEDQENSKERLQQAVNELTEQLQREMPKSLWD